MQGLVWLLLLFGLCFAVERAVHELKGPNAAALLTRARCLLGSILAGYLIGAAGSYLLFHQPLTGPVGQ